MSALRGARRALLILAAALPVALPAADPAGGGDIYDAAVAHPGRPAHDLKRDPLEHPAEVLRLTDIKPGMQVADYMAADG
jgi:predicted methyltransferase